jgi:hypothetical protein
MTLDLASPPVIALVAPGVVSAALQIFVDTAAMSEADQIILDTQLQLLDDVAERMGVTGELRMIAHAGGLDDEFVGNETIRLQDVDSAQQAAAWAILQTIVMIGAKYPDRRALAQPQP